MAKPKAKTKNENPWVKRRAEAVATRTAAFVAVLKQRIAWHHEQWKETEDEAEKEIHYNMVMDDEEKLLEAEEGYEKQRKTAKKYGINMPDIDFTGDMPDIDFVNENDVL